MRMMVLLVATLLMSGCDEVMIHPIVGIWSADPPEEVTIRYHDDYTFLLDDQGRGNVMSGTWEWNDPTLTMTFTKIDSSRLDEAVVIELQPRTLTRLCIPDVVELDRETCFTR